MRATTIAMMVRVLSNATLTLPKRMPVFFESSRTNASAGKHDYIGNNLETDAECHDNAANDQVNKGWTPRTAEAGRDKAHGFVNAEAEEERNRNL